MYISSKFKCKLSFQLIHRFKQGLCNPVKDVRIKSTVFHPKAKRILKSCVLYYM